MENLPVRDAPRQRMNREESWHKTAPPLRHHGCTKGKSCSLLASPYPFSVVASRPTPATLAPISAASRQKLAFLMPFRLGLSAKTGSRRTGSFKRYPEIGRVSFPQ